MLNELNTFIAKNGDIEKERIELGHYYHSAGSFHVYEKHYTMCEKITNNYWQKCQQNSYPVLNIMLTENISPTLRTTFPSPPGHSDTPRTSRGWGAGGNKTY